MKRYFAILAAGVLLAGTVGAAAPQVTIRWHGQSYFEIESSKGTRIVLDPHGIEAYGRQDTTADVITISHLHNDHTQTDVVRNLNKAKVFWGLKGSDKKTTWNPIDEAFRDVHIRTVGTYHDTTEGME